MLSASLPCLLAMYESVACCAHPQPAHALPKTQRPALESWGKRACGRECGAWLWCCSRVGAFVTPTSRPHPPPCPSLPSSAVRGCCCFPPDSPLPPHEPARMRGLHLHAAATGRTTMPAVVSAAVTAGGSSTAVLHDPSNSSSEEDDVDWADEDAQVGGRVLNHTPPPHCCRRHARVRGRPCMRRCRAVDPPPPPLTVPL
jgi:hypothetical protein